MRLSWADAAVAIFENFSLIVSFIARSPVTIYVAPTKVGVQVFNWPFSFGIWKRHFLALSLGRIPAFAGMTNLSS